MRTLAGPAQAVLGKRLGLAALVEMELTATLRMTTANVDLEWPVGSGNRFIGRRAVAIDAIRDHGGEVQGLKFSLSGVPADMLEIALAEPIQGAAVRVYVAVLDADTEAILDASQTWAGTLDLMPITQTGATATVSVTAEHRGILFARPKGKRYTDADQQSLYPGDKCLEFIISQSQHADTWPAASFFRQ